MMVAVGQALERHVALDQLGLQNVHHGLELELVLAVQQDLVVLLVELDGGVRVLQIVALGNLFQRLLHGVVHFRHFDFGNDVEAVVGHGLFGVLRCPVPVWPTSNPSTELERRRRGVTRRTGSMRVAAGHGGRRLGRLGMRDRVPARRQAARPHGRQRRAVAGSGLGLAAVKAAITRFEISSDQRRPWRHRAPP